MTWGWGRQEEKEEKKETSGYFLVVDLESLISFSPQTDPLEFSVKTYLEGKENNCWKGTKECEKGKEECKILLLKKLFK